MRRKVLFSAAAMIGTIATGQLAMAATPVKVTVTNNAPAGGVYVTPVWVGFHDGSFDSYNPGLSAQPGVEQIAEVGDPTTLSADFLGGQTYIDNSGVDPVSATVASSQAGADRVDTTTMGGPIAPGASAMTGILVIDAAVANQYFSYASMVLPSSDYFIANGDPVAIDLSALEGAAIGETITFNVGLPGTVNDAGTEVNDFLTSAGNGLFPGLPASDAPSGADEGGVVANVANPFSDFLNTPGGFDFSDLDFNQYSGETGIATITIEVVPEPASMAMLGLGAIGLLARRRR